MKEFSLNGSLRTEAGKKIAKRLRYDEQVPAILYGGEGNILLSVADRDLKNLIYTPNVYLINLNIDKKKYKAILKDIQFHPVTDRILHLDFLEVFEDKKLKVAIPVILTGSSVGVRKGGKLTLAKRRIRVYGYLKDIPEDIKIDITKLDIGQSKQIRDLKIDNLEFIEPEDAVIAIVRTARLAKVGDEEDEDEEGVEGEEGAEGEEGGATEGETAEE